MNELIMNDSATSKITPIRKTPLVEKLGHSIVGWRSQKTTWSGKESIYFEFHLDNNVTRRDDIETLFRVLQNNLKHHHGIDLIQAAWTLDMQSRVSDFQGPILQMQIKAEDLDKLEGAIKALGEQKKLSLG